MYISNQADLALLIEKLKGSRLIAIDTEFHYEKTYYAKLCLVQVCNGDIDAIIDPLRIGNLKPLGELLSDPDIVKVFHAGNQDIEILNRVVGVCPSPIFDTQVAAGLLGYPQQLGLSALVKAFCDVNLAKTDSLTDWTRRPLSPTQIEYAIDDVLYLPQIYDKMAAQLEKSGRMEWLKSDFEHMSDPATYVVDPDQMWRKVKRVSSLTRKQLAVAQVMASWRERTAQRRNLPRKWVLPDEMIVEVSRRCPTTRESMLEIRGFGDRLAESSIKEILADIKKALEADPESWPRIAKSSGRQKEVEGAVDLMATLLHLRAKQNAVTTQFLCTRDDLVKLAKGEGDELPLLSGWRYRIVGNELMQLLEGTISIAIVDGELVVEKRG
ncbi:MAG: ribonuclease D [Coriobacteriales bacterium]|nr:ribonuclease D [Coriobacteriales bacterium]